MHFGGGDSTVGTAVSPPSMPPLQLKAPRERWVIRKGAHGEQMWIRVLLVRRPWAWYDGERRRGKRELRKQRKARAARASKLAQSAAAGRGEDDLPGRGRLPPGAHRWLTNSGVRYMY